MCLGIPGRVIALEEGGEPPMGTVDFGGVRKQVCLAYLPEAALGDYVIVHVGFGISVVDPVEAERTLAVLRAMGDVVAAELGELGELDEPLSTDGPSAIAPSGKDAR